MSDLAPREWPGFDLLESYLLIISYQSVLVLVLFLDFLVPLVNIKHKISISFLPPVSQDNFKLSLVLGFCIFFIQLRQYIIMPYFNKRSIIRDNYFCII